MSRKRVFMGNSRFILCRNCDAVHHVSAFDKAPLHALSTGETSPADDWHAFMDQHAGHSMMALKACGEHYFPAGLPSDPMAVAYIRVTNGQREFVLRRFRRSIAEPVRFERIEGAFGTPVAALEIQEREIRKELELRVRGADGQPLSGAKVALFIALFRATASQVDPSGVTASEPSYANDNIAYVALETSTRASLLKQCADHFAAREVDVLRRFIEAESRGSGVMTLMLRRRIPVAEGV